MHPSTLLAPVLNFAKKILSLGFPISSIRRLFSVLCFWAKLFGHKSPASGGPLIRRERFHRKRDNPPTTICASILPGVEGEIVITRPPSTSIQPIHSPCPVRKFASQDGYPTAAISRSSLDKACSNDNINKEPKCYTVEAGISTIGASSSDNDTLTEDPYSLYTSNLMNIPPYMRSVASPSSSRHSLHVPSADNNNFNEPILRPVSSASSVSRRSRASYPRYTAPLLPLTNIEATSSHNGPNGAVAVAPARLIAQPNGDRPGTPVLVFESSIPEVHPLLTMHASEQRYGMTHKISTDQQSHEIPALQLSYPEHDGALPPEWTKPLQPEGACYFMHKERRIFTHADICDPDVLDDIINLADHIQKELQCQLSSDYHNEIELVIEPRTGKNDALVGLYYFVDPRNQCVFWLENCDGSPFLNECKGVRQLSHKKLAVTAQYWKHWELFPNLCHVSEDILEELKNMLLQARCDHIMSEESTAPLNAEVLSQLFDIVNNIKLTGNPNLSVYRAWIVGRIMHEFARNQFLNFYGQKCARLGVLQSIYGEDLEQRSWKMSVLSHALFGAPKVHVEALHKLYVDGIACTFTWKRFMENLNSEVQDFNLLASVLLNANVGFLAIQSVDNGSGANDNARSLTQIASYLSLVASVGSIVLGLVLVRHTRTKKNDSADKTANFLRHMKHNQFGQETLAVIYSLPYALLMWGMLLFLAAFSFECYKPADDLSRLLVGITSLAVGLLVIWCIVALRAGLNGRDADWRNFVPRRVQKILDREVTGQDMEDDNGSQLSVISRLWQFASLGKAVRAQSSQDPDIELAAAGSNSGVHCTLRVRAATGDSVPSSEVEA